MQGLVVGRGEGGLGKHKLELNVFESLTLLHKDESTLYFIFNIFVLT